MTHSPETEHSTGPKSQREILLTDYSRHWMPGTWLRGGKNSEKLQFCRTPLAQAVRWHGRCKELWWTASRGEVQLSGAAWVRPRIITVSPTQGHSHPPSRSTARSRETPAAASWTGHRGITHRGMSQVRWRKPACRNPGEAAPRGPQED